MHNDINADVMVPGYEYGYSSQVIINKLHNDKQQFLKHRVWDWEATRASLLIYSFTAFMLQQWPR